MAVRNATDLFQNELGDMYSAEHLISKILPQLASESADAQVKSAFEMHERETQQQIQNLDQCFNLLGVQAPKVECEAVKGLKQEHETFKKEHPPEDVLTMFDLGAALKTEHYEIASYTGLIGMARLMGQTQIVQLLERNLNQEQAMAQKVEQLSRQLGQRLAPQSPHTAVGQQPTA